MGPFREGLLRLSHPGETPPVVARVRCTTNPKGRTLKIRPHNQLLIKARRRFENPETLARYHQHRPAVERIIAWVVANGTENSDTEAPNPTDNNSTPAPPPSTYADSSTSAYTNTPTGWAIHPT